MTQPTDGVPTDDVMTRIGHGLTLSQQGDRAAAREVFREIWDGDGAGLDAFHRCALAHSMADVQDSADEELVWDLRALEAADSVTEERVRQSGVSASSVRAFYPSLYLNLGDVSRRLGRSDAARRYARLGLDAVDVLNDDGYGRMIRNGLSRLEARLDEAPDDAPFGEDDTGDLETIP